MTTLKQALKNMLTKKELENVPSSFDVVGSIAIIDIPPELKKKEKIIAETMIKLFKPVKTVVKKSGIHYGKYRRQKLDVIAGEKTKVAEYKESGVRIKVDLEKAYFSSRLGTERLRIAKRVKPKEKVLVMFSGVAPFPLVIAKNSKPGIIYAVEMNPVAHEYAEHNVVLNKMQDKIKLFKGDVRDVVPKLKKKFDRILMPMPKTSRTFLETAFKAAKKGTIIHFYAFGREEDEFQLIRDAVKEECKQHKKKCRIIRTVKAGHYAPGVYRVCIDFRLL
ncbi:class I SAM-dependent methyltransferase family protein [Candidatus Woesearchaeota archaeon]|nr:class I SAM-dependent methyltransferase family protein [Candidatus Woesearchaeota archaeon]